MSPSGSSIEPTVPSSPPDGRPTHRGPFGIHDRPVFHVGFHDQVFNDILIPRFKEAFTLDYFHAMLVQLAFYRMNALSRTIPDSSCLAKPGLHKKSPFISDKEGSHDPLSTTVSGAAKRFDAIQWIICQIRRCLGDCVHRHNLKRVGCDKAP